MRRRILTGAQALLLVCLALVLPACALPAGLVASYSGNGTALSGTGSFNGSYTGTYASVGGREAFSFSTGGPDMTASANGLPAGSSPFTISAWVYVSAFQSSTYRLGMYVLYGSGANQADIVTYTNPGGVYSGTAQAYYDNGQYSDYGGPAIGLNTWNYIAATYDGSSTVSVYLNGVLAGSRGYGALAVNTSAGPTLQIGGQTLGGSVGGTGYMSDIHIYNIGMSQTQIQSDMALTSLPEPPLASLCLGGVIALTLVRRRQCSRSVRP